MIQSGLCEAILITLARFQINLRRIGSMLRLRRAKDLHHEPAYLYTQRFSKFFWVGWFALKDSGHRDKLFCVQGLRLLAYRNRPTSPDSRQVLRRRLKMKMTSTTRLLSKNERFLVGSFSEKMVTIWGFLAK